MKFLVLIIIVLVVFPPAGLLLAGVFLYCLGNRWEKQLNREDKEMVKEVRIDEYNNQTLELMK